MKIERIRIKNFKGFTESTFILNPGFTVFIGDNATGKTTVLDALAVAVGSYLRGIDVAKHEPRGIERSEIRVATFDGQPLPQLPVEIQAFGSVNGREMEGGWLRTVDKISKKTITTYAGAKNIERYAAEMLLDSRAGQKVTFPVIAYHGTGRLWAQHEVTKTPYTRSGEGVSQAYTNCLSPKSSGKDFLSWYKTYEDEVRKFEQETDKILLKTFNTAVVSMIPEDHWQEMAYSFAEDDLIGIFTTATGSKEKLRFSQLSDGYRNVLGMVADIAYRCIKLNPHLKEDAVKATPGIVLIDEVDLHLHPNWQRRIVADLKKTFPQIQFIATTHSPFIVQSLGSDEVWNLDKTMDVAPGELKIDTVATEIMGVKSPYSEENNNLYEQSRAFLKGLSTEKTLNGFDKELKEIDNPAVRAFLELNKMSHGK